MDVNDVAFGDLPPHFSTLSLTQNEWESILPGYTHFYPSCFRRAVPYLLASIVYHSEWLKSIVAKDHPFFRCLLWTSRIVPTLVSQVQSGNLTNASTNMRATGVPPHVVLSSRMSNMESTLTSLNETVSEFVPKMGFEIAQQMKVFQETMP